MNESIKGIKNPEYRVTKAKRSFSPDREIIRMAKRLKLNINKLGGLNSHKQEFWNNPWSDLIRSLYEKRFGVRSL